ncbi:unnamed protein product [Candida verbasci]|uniref:N-acetylglucosamine-induced protein 1 n=1 Tax=Candida verbasci TaxID=1227364 RepID=A0A9W4TVG7_9ASCO|nr:unnamed protein product [Candida verbasci]
MTITSIPKQLNTPPTSPTFDKYYKSFNIETHQSKLMPQPSKIKHGDPFNWQDIQFIINSNQLELFARSEQQTIKYHNFKQYLKDRNININDYLLNHELHWKEDDLRDQEFPNDKLEYDLNNKQDLIFFNPNDLEILPNKFPYYFDSNIKHLCVWSKLKIPNDSKSEVGDISELSKKIIHKYLEKTFVNKGIKWDQIVWFKNWLTLQSVKSISHIHILLKDVDDEFIDSLIGKSGEVLTIEDYRDLIDY